MGLESYLAMARNPQHALAVTLSPAERGQGFLTQHRGRWRSTPAPSSMEDRHLSTMAPLFPCDLDALYFATDPCRRTLRGQHRHHLACDGDIGPFALASWDVGVAASGFRRNRLHARTWPHARGRAPAHSVGQRLRHHHAPARQTNATWGAVSSSAPGRFALTPQSILGTP
jgi:hypothetical protein